MKNLMKSFLCLLMALLMVLGLAACGSQSTGAEDAKPQETEEEDAQSQEDGNAQASGEPYQGGEPFQGGQPYSYGDMEDFFRQFFGFGF